MRAAAFVFFAVAICGMLFMINMHLAALFGYSISSLGLVVWIPTVFASARLSRNFKRSDMRNAILRGCPKWARAALYISLSYAFIVIFALHTLAVMAAAGIIFYAISVAVLYSYIRVLHRDPGPARTAIPFRLLPDIVINAEWKLPCQ
jgi:hypothetical protein